MLQLQRMISAVVVCQMYDVQLFLRQKCVDFNSNKSAARVKNHAKHQISQPITPTFTASKVIHDFRELVTFNQRIIVAQNRTSHSSGHPRHNHPTSTRPSQSMAHYLVHYGPAPATTRAETSNFPKFKCDLAWARKSDDSALQRDPRRDQALEAGAH